MQVRKIKHGEIITEPGVYDTPIGWYHNQCTAGPSISSSGLRKIFQKSPAHFWDQSSLNPDAEPEDAEKEAFVLGRAAHHLILGEAAFSTLFIARPEELPDEQGELKPWHGARNVCKKWLREQHAAGRTVVTQGQLTQIRGMARSLARHPLVQAGILNGEIERSLVWRDAATGVWLKVRPDAIPADAGDFADLKTTAEVGFDQDWSIEDYRYDMQAALVGAGAEAVLGLKMQSFSFVFVEKKRPHCTDVMSLTEGELIDAGMDLRTSIDTFAYCLRTGDWFGPQGSQLDARYVQRGERAKERAMARRAFLAREILQSPAPVEDKRDTEAFLG